MISIPSITNGARRAFTLVELVVVIAILVAIAGLVIMSSDSVLHGSNGKSGALAQATRLTLASVRDAIEGEPDRPGFRQDMGEIPAQLADLFRVPSALPSGAIVSGGALEQYDPVHQRGWNGPYLMHNTGYYHVDAAHGFLAQYGSDGEAALVDAWGSPIVLQIPPAGSLAQQFEYARLVSAGPDKSVDTDPSALAPDIDDAAVVDDDIVLYLVRANGP